MTAPCGPRPGLSPVHARALEFAATGCSVVPAKADGSKAPLGDWKRWQTERPDVEQIGRWFGAGHPGIGVVCGAVSGGLVMVEFEGRAADLVPKAAEVALAAGDAELWRRVFGGYLEVTPSGGLHMLYRITGGPVPGNQKIARRPDADLRDGPTVEVLIETRGEGGFVVVAPSGGAVHASGNGWVQITGGPTTIPTLTIDEHEAVCSILRTFDAMPAPTAPAPSTPRPAPRVDGELTPGDDFEQRTSWLELLGRHGWRPVGQRGSTTDWCRPGKDGPAVSATTNYGSDEHDLLYVFSSSTVFEAEHSYSKFGALAVLEFGGDHAAAARALRRDGYGSERQPLDAGLAPLRSLTPAELGVPDIAGQPPARSSSTATDLAAQLWERPELARIRDFARARMASPVAVLGVTLARVLTAVPPHIVLPATVGSYGSLNTYIALVGPSGGGKGAAEQAAGDVIALPEVETFTAGSGEGLAHLFAHREKQTVIPDRSAVLLTIPEVDNLVALGSRQGSTLLPQLRIGWSGEALGFAYADPAKRLPIPRHTYRLNIVLGVQPMRAGPLFDDADGGTPQRFLWLSVLDPDAPDVTPAEPAPLAMPASLAGWPSGVRGVHPLPVPDVATEAVREARRARLRGDGEALDGHALLCRLKVAAGLALLANRRAVTDDDWTLAGVVMAISDRTRAGVVAQLAERAQQSNAARGRAEGTRAAVAADAAEDHAATRVAKRLGQHLADVGEASQSELRRRVTNRDRHVFDQAVERLVAAGQVKPLEADGVARLRWVGPA